MKPTTKAQRAPNGDTGDDKGKYFERIRSLVVHEDDLVNNRLTWLLTIEGFLISGFVLVQQSALSNDPPFAVIACTEGLFICIFIAAIWICYITGVNIAAAYEQVAAVSRMWENLYEEEKIEPPPPYPMWIREPPDAAQDPPKSKAEYPPVFGCYKYATRHRLKTWFTSAKRIPFILMVINLLAIGVSGAMIVFFLERNTIKVNADIKISPDGPHYTADYEGARSKQDMVNYLKWVTHELETQPATQP